MDRRQLACQWVESEGEGRVDRVGEGTKLLLLLLRLLLGILGSGHMPMDNLYLLKKPN